jgi:BAG domain/Ubiquitin family
VASSSIQIWTGNLASRLESLASNLPLPVQNLIRNVSASTLLKSAAQLETSTPTIDKVYSLLTTYSAVSYTTVCATLLTVVFLCYKYSMSYYNSGGSRIDEGWGGRRSPYSASSARDSIADHVEYLTGDSPLPELRHSFSAHRTSVPSTYAYVDEEAPDTLLLRYKHQTYELHFKPYAISDGLLLVSDIRKYAAEKLGTDPRRLRLLYKGRTLRDDNLKAKAYHLKQNSEIMCVISEVEAMNGAVSDHSGSGDDSSVASNIQRPQRRRAESTARPRTEYQAQSQHSQSQHSQSQHSQPQYLSSSYSHHTPSISRHPDTRPSNENLHAPAMERTPSKQSSTGHASPPRARSPVPPPSRQSPPQPRHSTISTSTPIDPNSPLGKVNALSSAFHTQWLAKCEQFIMNPPSDPKNRDLEYAKLSESVLAQIVLKADNIEMEGDTDARAARKQLVNEASEILKRLDAVGKRRS